MSPRGHNFRASLVSGFVLLIALTGCVTPATRTDPTQTSNLPAGTEFRGTKRIVVGIAGDLPLLTNRVIRGVLAYTSPGGSEVEDLITDGLADQDGDDVPRAKLAEAVPSFENGLWKLLPNGQSETTWKIRENEIGRAHV